MSPGSLAGLWNLPSLPLRRTIHPSFTWRPVSLSPGAGYAAGAPPRLPRAGAFWETRQGAERYRGRFWKASLDRFGLGLLCQSRAQVRMSHYPPPLSTTNSVRFSCTRTPDQATFPDVKSS